MAKFLCVKTTLLTMFSAKTKAALLEDISRAALGLYHYQLETLCS